MGLTSIAMILGGVALLAWVIHYLRAVRLEVKTTREALEALAEAFRNAHHYPGPSAAAVVTEPVSGEHEVPEQLPAPVFARMALGASEARERRAPPGSVYAPPVDTAGDREGINPDAPPDTDREPPREAPLDVAQALGAEPGMVGLSLDESDAAQGELPFRRAARTAAPSEPPPAGVPVPTEDPAARQSALRRHPVMDEVTFRGTRGTSPVPTPVGAVLARLSSEARDRMGTLAAPADAAPVQGKFQAPPEVLEHLARLTPEEIARVDKLAANRGVGREKMMWIVLASGSPDASANDTLTAGPTTPPSGPANDADEAPDGERRG